MPLLKYLPTKQTLFSWAPEPSSSYEYRAWTSPGLPTFPWSPLGAQAFSYKNIIFQLEPVLSFSENPPRWASSLGLIYCELKIRSMPFSPSPGLFYLYYQRPGLETYAIEPRPTCFNNPMRQKIILMSKTRFIKDVFWYQRADRGALVATIDLENRSHLDHMVPSTRSLAGYQTWNTKQRSLTDIWSDSQLLTCALNSVITENNQNFEIMIAIKRSNRQK